MAKRCVQARRRGKRKISCNAIELEDQDGYVAVSHELGGASPCLQQFSQSRLCDHYLAKLRLCFHNCSLSHLVVFEEIVDTQALGREAETAEMVAAIRVGTSCSWSFCAVAFMIRFLALGCLFSKSFLVRWELRCIGCCGLGASMVRKSNWSLPA